MLRILVYVCMCRGMDVMIIVHCYCFGRFVLRNHIVQQAIETAEEGDYSEVRTYVTRELLVHSA